MAEATNTFNPNNDSYKISTLEDFVAFRNYVNEGNNCNKVTVTLEADIDLSSIENWEPIGSKSTPFNGTFDGQGHTISNLKCDYADEGRSYVGLFGWTNNGEIKNFTLENAEVSGYLGVGAVAGCPYTSDYTNITLTGDVKVEGFAYVGGMLGRNAYGDLTGLTIDVNDGSYVKADSVDDDGTAWRTYVGGVVGFMGEGGHKLTDISSNIDVEGSTCNVGGITGIAHYGNSFDNVTCEAESLKITNADPNDSATMEIGGIAGTWMNTGADVTMTDCSVSSDLQIEIQENGVTNDELTAKVQQNVLTGSGYYSNSSTALNVGSSSEYITSEILVANGVTYKADVAKLAAKIELDVTPSAADREFSVVVDATHVYDAVVPAGSDKIVLYVTDLVDGTYTFIAANKNDSEEVVYSVNTPLTNGVVKVNGGILDVNELVIGENSAVTVSGNSSIRIEKHTGKPIELTGGTLTDSYLGSGFDNQSSWLHVSGEAALAGSYTGQWIWVSGDDAKLTVKEGADVQVHATAGWYGFVVGGMNNDLTNPIYARPTYTQGGELVIEDGATAKAAYIYVGGNGQMTVAGAVDGVAQLEVHAGGIDGATAGELTVTGVISDVIYATISGTLNVEDGGKVAMAYVDGYAGRLTINGAVNVNEGGLLDFTSSNVTVNGTLKVDGESRLVGKTLTLGAEGKLVVDAAGFSGTSKIIDLAGTSLEGIVTIVNVPGDVRVYYRNDGDVILSNASTDKLYVDAAWAGKQFGDDLDNGKAYGINAYSKMADALTAVGNGNTIELSGTGSESGEIEFDKEISFTITGNAPEFALPVITFQNANVTIKEAVIKTPELDARQNAVITVDNATVYDGGGNSIIKSYYNGAVNIVNNSTAYAMQVTTMGYITIGGGSKLNATWQTNIYGNGLLVVKEDAVFATAALQLTGQDYSGRDNTDAGRVGQPATLVVDDATLIVGKVKASNDADYSYNSSKGMNIGTVAGKKVVLDIKNGATAEFYGADGQSVKVGADGTVNVTDSTLSVACRTAGGAVALNNAGTIALNNATLTAGTVNNSGRLVIAGTGTVVNADIVNKGVLAFGSDDAAVDTAFDITSIVSGSGNIEVKNGNVALTGTGTASAFYQLLIGAAISGDTSTAAAGVVIEDGATVKGRQILVGDNSTTKTTYDSLTVNGTLDLDNNSLYAKANSKVTVAGSIVDAKYIMGAGLTTVTGNVTVVGEASGRAIAIGNDAAWDCLFSIKGGVVTVSSGKTVAVGYSDTRNGKLEIVGGGKLITNGAVVVQAGSELTIDYTSRMVFDSLSGTIKVDADGYTGGTYKVLDSTGAALDYSTLISNYGELADAKIINNDLWITDATQEVLYVNAAYTTEEAALADGYILGYNAFASLNAAADALDNAGGKIKVSGDITIPANSNVIFAAGTTTLTGTANIAWNSSIWIGRGSDDAENGATVILDNARFGSLTNQASNGINVSGEKNGSSDTRDGILIIQNGSNVELDYLINRNVITVDASSLYVKNGFHVGGRPANETPSGETATAVMNLTNGATVTIDNENGMGLAYEGYGVLNITGSTFKSTQILSIGSGSAVNLTDGTLEVANYITNNGTIYVKGNSAVKATIGGSGQLIFDNVGLGNTTLIANRNGDGNDLLVKGSSVIHDGTVKLGKDNNVTVEDGASFTLYGNEDFEFGGKLSIGKDAVMNVTNSSLLKVEDAVAGDLLVNGGTVSVTTAKVNIGDAELYGKLVVSGGTFAAEDVVASSGADIHVVSSARVDVESLELVTLLNITGLTATAADRKINVVLMQNGAPVGDNIQVTVKAGETSASANVSGFSDGSYTAMILDLAVTQTPITQDVVIGNATLEIKDNSLVDVAGILNNTGTITMGNASVLTAGTLNNTGTIKMDALSSITAGEINEGSKIDITVNANVLTKNLYKVIDITGTSDLDTDCITINGAAYDESVKYGKHSFFEVGNDLYLINADMSVIYVNSAWADDAFGTVTDNGAIVGINAFDHFKKALACVEELGGGTISLMEGAYVYAPTLESDAHMATITEAGAYTITGGAGYLLNYELEVNPDKEAGLFEVNIVDAHFTSPKLTFRHGAQVTITDSRIDHQGWNGSGYFSVYRNSSVTITGSTIGYRAPHDVREDIDAWGHTFTVYGSANITNSLMYVYVGQGNQSGFDVLGSGRVTLTGSTVCLALLQVGTAYKDDRLDPAADTDNLVATVQISGSTLLNSQYRGDNATNSGIVLGQANGASSGRLIIAQNSLVDFTVKTYNSDARSVGLEIRNAASSLDLATGSTLKVVKASNAGTITVNDSTLVVTGAMTNTGTIKVAGASTVKAAVSGAGWVYMDGVTLDSNTKLTGAKVRFASGINTLNGAVVDGNFFQVGVGAYHGTDSNVDMANGVTVNVNGGTIGSSGSTYAGWVGSGFYDTDAEKAVAMTGASYTLNINEAIAAFGYLHVSNDGILNVTGKAAEQARYNGSTYSFYGGDFIINGTATFDGADVLAIYTKVGCDNGTTNAPAKLIITNGTEYEAERHNGAVAGTNFEIRKTGIVEVSDGAKLNLCEYSDIAAAASLSVSNASLKSEGTITNAGTIAITGSVFDTAGLTNTGTVTVGGASTLTAGVLDNTNAIRVDGATLTADTVTNTGTIKVSGTSTVKAAVSGAGWVYMDGVTLDSNTKLTGAKVRFASGINTLNGAVVTGGIIQLGIGEKHGVDSNVDTVNGVTVNVINGGTIGSEGNTYTGWIGSAYWYDDADKAAVMTDARYTLNVTNSLAMYGYLHISNDGILNVTGKAANQASYNGSACSFHSGDFIVNGLATFDATDVQVSYTKVSCDNGTATPGKLVIKNGTKYDATLAGAGTCFSIYNGGIVEVLGASTLTINKNSQISAAGSLSIDGSTLKSTGTITNAGTIAITGSVFDTAGLTNTGTITVGGASTLTIGNLTGTGTAAITGATIKAGSDISGADAEIATRILGANTIEAGATVNLAGSIVKLGSVGTDDDNPVAGTMETSSLTVKGNLAVNALYVGARYDDVIVDNCTATLTIDGGDVDVIGASGKTQGLVVRASGIVDIKNGGQLSMSEHACVVIQGAVTIDGAGSMLEVSKSPFAIYKDSGIVTVSNGGTLKLGAYQDTNVRVGLSDRHSGKLVLDGGNLILNETLNIWSTVEMDWESLVSFNETIIVQASGTFALSLEGYVGDHANNKLVFDYTGSAAGVPTLDYYKSLIGSAWNDNAFIYQDGDLYLSKDWTDNLVIDDLNTMTAEAAKAVGANTITVTGGTISDSTIAWEGSNVVIEDVVANKIILGTNLIDAGVKNWKDTATESSLTINGGTFNSNVIGATGVKSGCSEHVGDVNLVINGGTFAKDIAGGMYHTSDNIRDNAILSGDVNLTIAGGSFAGWVYGGNFGKKDSANAGIVNGNINLVIDSSVNDIAFAANVIAGSRGENDVLGNVSVTVTGLGSNLDFTGVLSGGCSGDYYRITSTGREAKTYVTGARDLTFDDFSGDFDARIALFESLAVTGDSVVNFTSAATNFGDIKTWSFEAGSSLIGVVNNDFTGDTLTFDLTGFEGAAWNVLTGDITGLADATIKLGDTVATWDDAVIGWVAGDYKLTVENDNMLVIGKLA